MRPVGKKHRAEEEDLDDDDRELIAMAMAGTQGGLPEQPSPCAFSASHATAMPAAASPRRGSAERLTSLSPHPAESQRHAPVGQPPPGASGLPARNAADVAGEYITVTSSSGERVYCGLGAGGSGGQPGRAPQHRQKGRYLQAPIASLLHEARRADAHAPPHMPPARVVCVQGKPLLIGMPCPVQLEQAAYARALEAEGCQGTSAAGSSAGRGGSGAQQPGSGSRHEVSYSLYLFQNVYTHVACLGGVEQANC
jgi:hypothetical protein